MADFYVNVATGNDANPGTSARPVRSIAQAIDLAAVSPDATGTIFVAAGTYEPPNERFPLLMRPGYVLQGEGRDRTLIRFTGETRIITGTMTTYWGGTAVMAGSAVRDLAIRANTLPEGFTCNGTIGLQANNDGTLIENVDVLAPELPEDRRVFARGPGRSAEPLQTGFSLSVLIYANVTYRNSRVSHSTHVVVAAGDSTLVDNVRLEWSFMGVSSNARVQNCEFRWVTVSPATGSASPLVTIVDGSPTIGPNNYFDMSARPVIDCRQNSTPTIIQNEIAVFYQPALSIREGASARVIGNRVFSDYTYDRAILEIAPDAGSGSMFEENTFYGSPHTFNIQAPADFGGGATGSRGGNHFGPMWASNKLVFDIPTGGVINAQNNFWNEGRPDSQTSVGATTTLITTGALVDPITPDEGLIQFRDILRSHPYSRGRMS